jgi:hypothetical protein
MLEIVLIQLQYCHNCGTKCEANIQAFFHAQFCILPDSLALPEQDATLSNNLLGLCNFELQMLSILCINLSLYELWMSLKTTSFLHSFRQHCTRFTCIPSKFHKKFKVNSVV